ncbi:MAG: hypothetical protein GXP38_00655 [Chloroflexi bacterium]|nr:hypothetical protein [Chloroflexota bacterium]
MNRSQLIERKQAVIAERQRLQRELERRRQDAQAHARRIRELERQIEQLQAEEYRLRLQIDRSRARG